MCITYNNQYQISRDELEGVGPMFKSTFETFKSSTLYTPNTSAPNTPVKGLSASNTPFKGAIGGKRAIGDKRHEKEKEKEKEKTLTTYSSVCHRNCLEVGWHCNHVGIERPVVFR